MRPIARGYCAYKPQSGKGQFAARNRVFLARRNFRAFPVEAGRNFRMALELKPRAGARRRSGNAPPSPQRGDAIRRRNTIQPQRRCISNHRGSRWHEADRAAQRRAEPPPHSKLPDARRCFAAPGSWPARRSGERPLQIAPAVCRQALQSQRFVDAEQAANLPCEPRFQGNILSIRILPGGRIASQGALSGAGGRRESLARSDFLLHRSVYDLRARSIDSDRDRFQTS